MHNLPNDIIYHLMQSHLGDNALDSLRHSSQISQTWRKLALSPILWARALNLENLRLKKDVWRTEVLRRTGNCTLEVKGSWIPSVTQDFFLHEFLVPNMHRIKTLHAEIGLMTNKVAEDPAWSVIYDQPAPLLEIFALDFEVRHYQDPPRAILDALEDGRSLFAGHAPTLHTSNGNSCLLHNLGTQPAPDWLPNLTTIMLTEAPETVLFILSQTPRLKRLLLTEHRPCGIRGLPVVSSVQLPHLEYLYKDHEYRDDCFVTIQQAIEVPPCIPIFVGFHQEACIPSVMTMFREFIEKTQPKKILMCWPSFGLCDFSLHSRPAAVGDIFRDQSCKDFAIQIKRLDFGHFLKLAMETGVDFGSVQEWHISRCHSDDWLKKETIAVLREFFTQVLRPGQALIVDKSEYERLKRNKHFPEGLLIELVENSPVDNDC